MCESPPRQPLSATAEPTRCWPLEFQRQQTTAQASLMSTTKHQQHNPHAAKLYTSSPALLARDAPAGAAASSPKVHVVRCTLCTNVSGHERSEEIDQDQGSAAMPIRYIFHLFRGRVSSAQVCFRQITTSILFSCHGYVNLRKNSGTEGTPALAGGVGVTYPT